ncbi:MAG: CHASE2 domain-containing protein [Verrucomicrobiaceae bacterium]|nr:CHASE2 domain-containing protein [Verrucomicrobiaceae bacterium]
MVRAILLLSVLLGLAWWLHGEQERGRFRRLDEGFLDFLLANARQEMKPDAAKLSDVVLVQIREEDKGEYAAWPPLPIDYQMIVKNLASYEPAVLVIADPLLWPEPKPEFIDSLAQALLPIPRVILAASIRSDGATDDASIKVLRERIPLMSRRNDSGSLLPEARRVEAMPEPALARQSDIGIITHGSANVAVRSNDSLMPSLELQALANAGQVPFERIRVTTGPGAGVHFSDAWFVPTQHNGTWARTDVSLTKVNALDLMVPEVTGTDADLAKVLGKGKTIILGMACDDQGATSKASQCAATAASALALPRVNVLSSTGQFIAWGIAGCLGLLLLLGPKHKAITRALLILFLALTASYLAFQALQVWCPPAIPSALILASGLLVRLFGRRPKDEPTTTCE